MPIPQQLGRGDKMGRGPYEKSGMIRDTGLPPLRTVHENFEILFPVQETKKGDTVERNILDYEMNIKVELWYLPFGTFSDSAALWRSVTKKVSIKRGGV